MQCRSLLIQWSSPAPREIRSEQQNMPVMAEMFSRLPMGMKRRSASRGVGRRASHGTRETTTESTCAHHAGCWPRLIASSKPERGAARNGCASWRGVRVAERDERRRARGAAWRAPVGVAHASIPGRRSGAEAGGRGPWGTRPAGTAHGRRYFTALPQLRAV